jgi:hypothetical protein
MLLSHMPNHIILSRKRLRTSLILTRYTSLHLMYTLGMPCQVSLEVESFIAVRYTAGEALLVSAEPVLVELAFEAKGFGAFRAVVAGWL